MNKHTNIGKRVFFTPEGLLRAQAELKFLKTGKREEVTDRIEKAIEFGDVEENSEYNAALDEQTFVETKIAELENALSRARVIANPTGNEFVVIGSTVKVEIDKEIDEFTIVGKVEANPAKKKISNESPMGLALLGAKVGEVVEVVTPIVRYKCKVLGIK